MNYEQRYFPYKGLEFPSDVFKTTPLEDQKQVIEFLLHRENNNYDGIVGGFCFNEMGTGKTFCALSLVALNSDEFYTLIIVPSHLISHWKNEIEKHFNGISYVLFYGTSRRKELLDYIATKGKPRIIISSYQTVQRDIQLANSPLLSINFSRMILDEIHAIRNQDSLAFKAILQIDAKKIICLSGTPLINRSQDMYSYLKLLKFKYIHRIPSYNRFNRFQNSTVHTSTYRGMQNLLQNIAIRRTNESLNLPEKTETDIYLDLEPVENQFYMAFRNYSRIRLKKLFRNIERIKYSGLEMHIQNSLRLIILQCLLGLIFNLRLACCDQLLIIDKIPKTKGMDLETAVETLIEADFSGDCPVCYNAKKTKYHPECRHTFCDDCFNRLSKIGICLQCLEYFEFEKCIDIPVEENYNNPDFHSKRVFYKSTKTKKVLEIIKDKLDRGQKIVIVSQWVIYLDSIIEQFTYEFPGVEFIKLSGQVTPKKRQVSIDNFQNNENIKVCFASLNSSAEGISLTSSSNMVVCDVFWNAAKIDQISARVHRISQVNPVDIYKIYVKNSIEMKLKDLVEKKSAICEILTEGKAITAKTETLISKIVNLLEDPTS